MVWVEEMKRWAETYHSCIRSLTAKIASQKKDHEAAVEVAEAAMDENHKQELAKQAESHMQAMEAAPWAGACRSRSRLPESAAMRASCMPEYTAIRRAGTRSAG